MKKFILILTIAFAFLWQGAGSQNLIAVQNGETASFYASLDTAILNADDGDTIFIPCGTFNLSVNINTELHFIGVGFSSDSATACGITRINGSLNFYQGSSNGSFIGISFDNFKFYENVSYFSIDRCNFGSIEKAAGTATISNFEIKNCKFSGFHSQWLYEYSGHYCYVYNNIIWGPSSGSLVNCIFSNNIFAYGIQWNGAWGIWEHPLNGQNSLYQNNILTGTSYGLYNILSGVANSFFNNNLFVQNWAGPSGDIYGSDNIVNVPIENIFVNYNSGNYHLVPVCPGIGAGIDGTDVGIYGWPYPWKDGSIPINPHITQYSISGTTNQDGNLNVNIKVSAQDR